jgi:hypothetical protein
LLLTQLLAGLELPGLPLDEAVLEPGAIIDTRSPLLEYLHLALRTSTLLEPLLLKDLPLGPRALLEPRHSTAAAAILERALGALLHLRSLLLPLLALLLLLAAAALPALRLLLLLRGLIAVLAALIGLGRSGNGERRNGSHQKGPGHGEFPFKTSGQILAKTA